MALARSYQFLALSMSLAISSFNVTATPVTSGEANISLAPQAWQNLGITIDNVVTSQESLTSSVQTLLQQPAADNFDSQSTDPYTFTLMMGASPYVDTDRRLAPLTSFTVTGQDNASFETTARGELSLAGVTRWRISPLLGGGRLIIGDLTLRFNTQSQRWEISNNIDFPGVIYTIGSPEYNVTETQITLSGDIIGDTFLDSMVVGSLNQDLGDIHVTMTRAQDGTIRAANAAITYDLPFWASVGLTELDNFIGAEGVGLYAGPVEGDDLLDIARADNFTASAAHDSPMLTPASAYTQTGRLAPFTFFDANTSTENTFNQESRGHLSLVGAIRLSSTLGNVLLGDFTLEYLPNTSTWQVVNHISFPATVFDVENVELTVGDDNAFRVKGDLVGSTQLASLIPGAEDVVLGTISFTTGNISEPTPNPTPTPVPTPTPSSGGSSGSLFWLLPLGLLAASRRKM